MPGRLANWGLALLLPVTCLATVGDDLRLAQAAQAQDKAAVRSLVAQKVGLNSRQPDGTTALHWAAHWDDAEMAAMLIQAGADVNAANEAGASPLWLASSNGSSEMVEKLLKAGANPNVALHLGETPLQAAAGAGSTDVVKLLLAAGADVNARETQRGQTALMWAVAERRAEVARILIERGADVRARSKGGFTPLLFAAQQDDLESARILMAAGSDVNEASAEAMTPLLVAAASGHEAMTNLLLEKGSNPNLADYKGFAPLHYAAMRRDMAESVKSLLEHGADPNARVAKPAANEMAPVPDLPFLQAPTRIVKAGTPGGTLPIGATPYYLAAQRLNASAMRILAAGGADPNLGTTETVYLLGGSGRRVNFIAGTTPLMAAAGVDTVVDNSRRRREAGSGGRAGGDRGGSRCERCQRVRPDCSARRFVHWSRIHHSVLGGKGRPSRR